MKNVLVFLLLLPACMVYAQNEPAEQYKEYTYLTRGDDVLKAYVFSPKDQAAQAMPAIVFFHGGGWVDGEAAWCFGLAEHYASLGMVAVSMEYRISDQEHITPVDAMKDAEEAIVWMRSHAEMLHIDPDRVAAYGVSAGGHLATAAATFGDAMSAPNAIVLVSPALSVENDGWFVQLLMGRTDASALSPFKHVRAGLPPTLILQGCTDTVTPLIYAMAYTIRMKDAKNRCELKIYHGYGHLFTPSSRPDYNGVYPDPDVEAEALMEADAFLNSLGYITVHEPWIMP